jgi:8-oxo-dGTP diphosphatase
MSSPRVQFTIAVDVFLVRDGKLLMGKRQNTFGAGFWGLPGGHLEKDETVEMAALRELKEETGLVAENVTFAIVFNNNNREEPYIHFGMLASGVSGEPQLKEPDKFSGWQWFDLNDLPNEQTLWVHAPMIKAFKTGKPLVNHS